MDFQWTCILEKQFLIQSIFLFLEHNKNLKGLKQCYITRILSKLKISDGTSVGCIPKIPLLDKIIIKKLEHNLYTICTLMCNTVCSLYIVGTSLYPSAYM